MRRSAVIVDDEPQALQKLHRLLGEHEDHQRARSRSVRAAHLSPGVVAIEAVHTIFRLIQGASEHGERATHLRNVDHCRCYGGQAREFRARALARRSFSGGGCRAVRGAKPLG